VARDSETEGIASPHIYTTVIYPSEATLRVNIKNAAAFSAMGNHKKHVDARQYSPVRDK